MTYAPPRDQPLMRPMLTGSVGMSASTHWLAAATAMSVLERGGNAFDAAAAGGFVLQVVEPHLNGPGGEVPILLWSHRDQAVSVVCGQGVAPAAATIERFAGLGLDRVPGTGLLAATVPGAFDGWLRLLAEWGTWPIRDVLEYAIHYAQQGFPAIPGVTRTIDRVATMLADDWPTSAAQWLPGGSVPVTGSTLTNMPLAATYRRIIELAEVAGSDRDRQIQAAREAWSHGFVAEAIADFCAATSWRDTSGRRHGGLLTADDLAGWQASVEAPVGLDCRDYTVYKTGPWGQGPVFLQQLALLDTLDLGATEFLSADYIHLVTEASKLAFADREAWYGEDAPAGVVPDLLSPSYTAERAALIGDSASLDLRPGSPGGRVPRLPVYDTSATEPPVEGTGSGEPTIDRNGQTQGDTCHIDVADQFGNLVSATPSGGWLHSSPYLPDLGFCLGTRAQMFWLQPGLPSSLRPGARPRTTLSPSLALRDGQPWLAFGTPGGDQQDQWSLDFFLALVHGGTAIEGNLQAAIESPMFHSEHMPSSFWPRRAEPGRLVVESRLGDDVVGELRHRGHDVVVEGPWSLGRLCAVANDPVTGVLSAAANPRGAQGYAAGR